MKIIFDIDCTPEEARQFLGLPNVATMQDAVMKEIEAKMRDNIRNLDPETFVQTWLPATIQGWGEMQKIFWGQMGQANPAEPKKGKK
jgi:hypothetical protein